MSKLATTSKKLFNIDKEARAFYPVDDINRSKRFNSSKGVPQYAVVKQHLSGSNRRRFGGSYKVAVV